MASRSSFRFQRQGKAGEHYDCLFNHCRYFLIDLACNIAKSSGKGVVGYNAQTHFVGDQNDRPPCGLKRAHQPFRGGSRIAFRHQQVRSPKRQAIHQHHRSRRAICRDRVRQFQRGLDG